ncbi:hypothetical protein JKA73_03050 [Myxococcus xanthus]|uniref:imm11 family protein n=1 Tax=Myxococcus xanthus TaxID=34 RepID=UPI0019172094|nr:DUF1629 domain-containing protein [Myxococcus xanthus]QQR45134.1 hypothetical protein JKA73_03050 [Myxococcus xanthus]
MLDPLEGMDRSYELLKGIPQSGRFPSTALFRMSANYPKDIGLTDSLANVNELLVASRRLKEFLEARKLPNLEYLAVSVLDHKGRVASNEYFLVHPIQPQDCLDLQASNPRYNKINPSLISRVDELVIDVSKITPGVGLFRLAGFGKPLIIHRELATEISQAGFVGPVFIELNRYGK